MFHFHRPIEKTRGNNAHSTIPLGSHDHLISCSSRLGYSLLKRTGQRNFRLPGFFNNQLHLGPLIKGLVKNTFLILKPGESISPAYQTQGVSFTVRRFLKLTVSPGGKERVQNKKILQNMTPQGVYNPPAGQSPWCCKPRGVNLPWFMIPRGINLPWVSDLGKSLMIHGSRQPCLKTFTEAFKGTGTVSQNECGFLFN